MTPYVIDIYHLNPVLDFEAVVGAGTLGCIHKAYEAGVADPLYATRRKAFADAGLKGWGAYCFFHGSDRGGNPSAEADNFLSVAEPDANTLIALDWETDEDGYVPPAADARAFLERIETKLGRKAVIYSGNVAKEKLSGKDVYFGSHRLWLAQYALEWSVQASWASPWLWQYSESGKIPGMGGVSDCSSIIPPMTPADLLVQWAS